MGRDEGVRVADVVGDVVYDRRGSGAPLLLIHGLGSRWQVWRPLLDQLAAARDVISIDLPGFGASPEDPAVTVGVRGYAHRVAGFIDELGLGAPEVAGNSMGGAIALELGRMGAASMVTAFSPIGFWTAIGVRWCEAVFTASRASARPIRHRLPALVRHPTARAALAGVFVGKPRQLDPQTLLADVEGLLDCPGLPGALATFSSYDLRNPDQDWGKLRHIPTTIAWGNRDALLTYKTQSVRARRALPWARHLTLRTCGHVPFYDDPVQCANVLLDLPGGSA